jgi:hypothetical protein
MAKPVFEQDLISMVTSLVHLRTVGEELRKKPFAIPRMEAALRDSLTAFNDLSSSFVRAEETLQQDAQPCLAQWLYARALQLGGEARFEGSNNAGVSRVRGRLSWVRIHPRQPSGTRCVELILEDASFSVGTMTGYAPFESFTQTQLSPVLGMHGHRAGVAKGDYRESSEKFNAAEIDRYVARILLPIKQEDIEKLARGVWYFRQI